LPDAVQRGAGGGSPASLSTSPLRSVALWLVGKRVAAAADAFLPYPFIFLGILLLREACRCSVRVINGAKRLAACGRHFASSLRKLMKNSGGRSCSPGNFNRHEAVAQAARLFSWRRSCWCCRCCSSRKQPDLGTAVLILAAGCYVIFLAGLSWKVLVGLSIAVAACMPLLVVAHATIISDRRNPHPARSHHRSARRGISHHPVDDSRWFRWCARQGLAKRHAGRNLEFIPERSTDFVFAGYFPRSSGSSATASCYCCTPR